MRSDFSFKRGDAKILPMAIPANILSSSTLLRLLRATQEKSMGGISFPAEGASSPNILESTVKLYHLFLGRAVPLIRSTIQ